MRALFYAEVFLDPLPRADISDTWKPQPTEARHGNARIHCASRMPKDAFNLTGHWSGEFSYPRHGGPTTPFLATIEDKGGRLTGTIIEPDVVSGASTAEARLRGLRHGSSVDFTKSYGPSPPLGYENPVDYVGSVSSDGNMISGVWSLLELDGRFEMRREEAANEEAEEEAEMALSEPVPSPLTGSAECLVEGDIHCRMSERALAERRHLLIQPARNLLDELLGQLPAQLPRQLRSFHVSYLP